MAFHLFGYRASEFYTPITLTFPRKWLRKEATHKNKQLWMQALFIIVIKNCIRVKLAFVLVTDYAAR